MPPPGPRPAVPPAPAPPLASLSVTLLRESVTFAEAQLEPVWPTGSTRWRPSCIFEYISPEQAEMNAFGVDTRSDGFTASAPKGPEADLNKTCATRPGGVDASSETN